MVGLTFSHARDVILTTFIKVLNMHNLIENIHYKINKSQLEIEILGKTKIYIKSIELGEKLRGYSVSDVFIDEAAYSNIDIFNILLGRIRESQDSQIHLITSPHGFNYVYDLTRRDDCEYIKVSTFKNPFLPKQYLKNMLNSYSSKFIQQELYADFVNITTGIFNSNNIKLLSKNSDLYHKFNINKYETVRFWDFGFSLDGDYSAGVLMTKIGSDYIISDIIRIRKLYPELKQLIIDTSKSDGIDVTIGLEKVGTQKGLVDDIIRSKELYNHIKRDFTVSKYGHKFKRILVLSSASENGQIYITDNCKNKLEFFRECDELSFDDTHSNDDMIDAATSAYLLLNNRSNPITGFKGLY